MDLLVALNHDRGLTTVMVTHDAEMAANAQRIVHFVDGLVSSDEVRQAVAS
jgi:putative ABC transport system ATP-binding protein